MGLAPSSETLAELISTIIPQ
ncbi:hypothetical protein PENANT_c099G08325 [Penicillium antarcticum]|uniref:Uncharacterized protein n=1 Tax=Penicillium antarcticum TaxID=416450 RepID=A0A1V6PLW4_9EURO|nr:hypothetical protein PENANT_c099G08325 [Penicillium antarcticum]